MQTLQVNGMNPVAKPCRIEPRARSPASEAAQRPVQSPAARQRQAAAPGRAPPQRRCPGAKRGPPMAPHPCGEPEALRCECHPLTWICLGRAASRHTEDS